MMKVVERRGKTVEEALQIALEDLGAAREQCVITVLEEPRAGWLGLIGGREALVRVEVDDAAREVKPAPGAPPLPPTHSRAQQAEEFLQEILSAMELEAKLRVTENQDSIHCEILGEDVGALIGRRGQTLGALHYLTNLVTGRHPEDRRRLLVDVAGYRQRREQRLRSLVERMAEQVIKTGNSVELEPMDGLERKIVHMALQNYPGVVTFSEGTDPYRKVIIAPAEE